MINYAQRERSKIFEVVFQKLKVHSSWKNYITNTIGRLVPKLVTNRRKRTASSLFIQPGGGGGVRVGKMGGDEHE